MPAVPQAVDLPPGVFPITALNSDVVAAVRFLLNPPIAKLLQTSAQSLTSGVSTAIQMNAEIVDTDINGVGGHDNATNNSRFTARYPGWYALIGGSISYNNHATGVRLGLWAVNGSVVHGCLTELLTAGAGTITSIPVAGTLVYLNVGDYVEMMGLQTSGGALLTTVSSTDKPNWSIKFASN